ncbi:MAG: hypothetical protein QOH46_2211 [Solirubrobacteraceae bacterium]|nr:hypothetical protein [Solirubrobacteraceae bacterium]
MGWVIKQWRLESLERLLADEALDALCAVRASADRDARRARREADRAACEAARELAALEQLGAELTLIVCRRRAAVRSAREGQQAFHASPLPEALTRRPATAEPSGRAWAHHAVTDAAPEPLPIPRPRRAAALPVTPPVDAIPVTAGHEPGRSGRASLRGSGLAELFRLTDARPVAPPATP